MSFDSSTVSVGQSTKKSNYDALLNNTQWNKGRLDTVYSGTATFSGIKTFNSSTVFVGEMTIASSTYSIRPQLPGIDSSTSTSGVSVQIPYCNESATVTSMVRLYKKIVEIGDWNMDTTPTKDVPHGVVDYSKIRKVSVIIRHDDNPENYDLCSTVTNENTAVPYGGINSIGAVNIGLVRCINQIFDATVFNATSYNRGWVIIEYEE